MCVTSSDGGVVVIQRDFLVIVNRVERRMYYSSLWSLTPSGRTES